MQDVTRNPDDHPECAAELGERPVYIRVSLMGAVLGQQSRVFGDFFGAVFLRQPRGGFPLIPIPPDIVITCELFILTAVFFTIIACSCFLIHAQKAACTRRDLGENIGILVKAERAAIAGIRDILSKHTTLEISESSECCALDKMWRWGDGSAYRRWPASRSRSRSHPRWRVRGPGAWTWPIKSASNPSMARTRSGRFRSVRCPCRAPTCSFTCMIAMAP